MKITKQLIDCYLKGQCSEAEANAVERYLQENPKGLEELIPEKEWNAMSTDYPYVEERKVYQKLQYKLKLPKQKTNYIYRIGQVAAILLVAFGIYQIASQRPTKQVEKQTALAKQPIMVDKTSDDSNLYYINSGNDNMVLKATDGSTITLYPQSEIKYAASFAGQKERLLYLKGKAKFEVAKDKTKPFRVHSKGIVTTALGTIFIVDEAKKSETSIQLLEGSIEVKAHNQINNKVLTRTIKPQEELILNHEQNTIIKEKKVQIAGIDREGFFEQKSQSLQFKNLALQDIIAILEQNYDLKITYDPTSLEGKFFSGTFSNSPTAYQAVIKELNYLHNLKLNYVKNK